MADEGLVSNLRVGYRASSADPWTAVHNLTNASIPDDIQERLDTTVFSAAKRKRSRPGYISTSPVELEALRSPDPSTAVGAEQKALRDLRIAGTTVTWRIEEACDDAGTDWFGVEFDGYIGTFKPVASLGQISKVQIVVEFDGDDLYYDAAAAASEVGE